MEDEKKTKKQLIEELNCLRLEQIEQAKVNSEKFTKAFLQNSIPTVITAIKDGRVVEVSDAFLRLAGLKRHEVIGRTAIEGGFLTEEQREVFFSELNKNGCVENLEMEISTRDGSLRYGLFNSVMMSISNEKFLLTAVQNITDRKQTEDALIKSENKYRKLVTEAHDAIVTQNFEGIITYCNPAAQTLAGGMDLIGVHLKDFIPPELVGKYEEMMDARCRGYADDISYEWSLVSPIDGSTHIFDVRSSLFVDESKHSGILTVGRDITERRRAEEVLRESEENYQLLFNNSFDAIAVFGGTPPQVLFVNSAFHRLFGYTPEEIFTFSTDDIFLLVHPDDREMVKNMLRGRHRQEKVPIRYEFRIITKSGEVRWVEVSASLYSKGNQIFSQAIYRDITERKKTEELLAKSAEKYRMIAESVNDCVVLVGDHGTIKYMANSIETIGYGQEEMVGIPGLNITHPDDMERVQKLYREGVKKVWREVTFEIRILHKDGHYVTLEVRAKTFTDPHGKVTGGVFVARNITQTQRGKLGQDISDTVGLTFANNNLTPREGEILNWIMQGKSTWDISTIINISERTVKFHIDNAIKKLGAVNRAHAVAIALRNELLN